MDSRKENTHATADITTKQATVKKTEGNVTRAWTCDTYRLHFIA
jgi:hypothetical protein